MDEEQRNSTFNLALLVHIVDVQYPESIYFDIPSELRELRVKSGFLRSPVKAVSPPSNETLDIVQRYTILLPRVFEFVWESDQGELLLEQLELVVWDRYFER